jgi:hypothetical protein
MESAIRIYMILVNQVITDAMFPVMSLPNSPLVIFNPYLGAISVLGIALENLLFISRQRLLKLATFGGNVQICGQAIQPKHRYETDI